MEDEQTEFSMNRPYQKGRGAQINPTSKYEAFVYDNTSDLEAEFPTEYIEVHPKTILNKVDSPDIGFSFSLNLTRAVNMVVFTAMRVTRTHTGTTALVWISNAKS